MKDHELRELINDATAVARLYAHTQQLREQISHVITPAIRTLEAKHAYLSGFKKGAELQIENLKQELAAAQAAANKSSTENIVLKKRLFQAQGGHHE
jgi:hypothetical protein